MKTGNHDFEIRFHATDGSKELTSLLDRSVGLAYSPATSNPMQIADMRDFEHYIFTQSTLSVGESVFGLGERFGAFNRVGQSVELWNADGGTSSDQAYKVRFVLFESGVDTNEMSECTILDEFAGIWYFHRYT